MTDQSSNWILRVEGANFNDTVFNTTDLSTIRGSSLALEAIGYEVEAWLKRQLEQDSFQKIYIGGSQAVFQLNATSGIVVESLAEELRQYLASPIQQAGDWPVYVDPKELGDFEQFLPDEQLRLLDTPSEHMTFMVDVERIDSGEPKDMLKVAINKAQMRSRRRQMRAPNLPRSPGASANSGSIVDRARLRCPIDPDRQISVDAGDRGCTLVARDSQFSGASEFIDPDTQQADRLEGKLKRIYTSKRAADLRPYGRDARRTLYAVQIGVEKYRELVAKGLFQTHDFARSFEDITAGPLPKELHPSVPGKLAFVYLDGNGFSKIRDDSDFAEFSRMCDSIGKEMLTGLLTPFLESARDAAKASAWCSERRIYTRTSRNDWNLVDRQLMRLETLIFGGEDACLVLPAWLAFDVTELLLKLAEDAGNQAARDWGGPDSRPVISFRAGVLICDARTPARRAVEAAKALCEDAKKAYVAGAQSAISFHISESHDLPEYAGSTQAMMRALRGAQFGAVEHQVATNKAFRALLVDWHRQKNDVIALKQSLARSQLYALIHELETFPDDTVDERYRRFDDFIETYKDRRRVEFNCEELRQKLPCNHEVPLILRLKVLAELWDYIDPLNSGDAGAEAKA